MWPFKKKEDELEKFERELGLSKERTGIETPSISAESEAPQPVEESYNKIPNEPETQMTPAARQTYQQQNPQMQAQSANDTQVISAKLDTIKAMLDLLNQRLDALDRKLEEKPKQRLF